MDKDNKVLVRAEILGIDKKDPDVSITDNLLTIKGQTSHENEEEEGG